MNIFNHIEISKGLAGNNTNEKNKKKIWEKLLNDEWGGGLWGGVEKQKNMLLLLSNFS